MLSMIFNQLYNYATKYSESLTVHLADGAVVSRGEEFRGYFFGERLATTKSESFVPLPAACARLSLNAKSGARVRTKVPFTDFFALKRTTGWLAGWLARFDRELP